MSQKAFRRIERLLKAPRNEEFVVGRIVGGKHKQRRVTQILTLKSKDPNADTRVLEAEIDQMVYGLYGLTDEVIAVVEMG